MLPPDERLPFELVDFGLGPYVHGRPSRRFPVYTRGNAGEVYPEVVFPLTSSMSVALAGDPARDAMLATGMMTAAECDEDADVHMGVFGGYTYLNLSVSRVIAVRTPGTTIAETDATFLGSEDIAPPHVGQRGDRNLMATVRGIRYGLSMLAGGPLSGFESDRSEVAAWRRSLPEAATASDDDLVALVEGAIVMLSRMFGNHLLVSGGAAAGLGLLRRVCEKRLDDADLALTLLAGLGDVASAQPSWDLWELGRMVTESAEVTACFESGLEGLEDRLRAEPTAAEFVVAFDAFLERHGARGPNEWEMACEVWDTDHRYPLALVDRMRVAGPDHAPAVRAALLATESEAALVAARSRLRRRHRRWFDRCLESAGSYTRAREAGKEHLVELIHECRLALHELGRRLAERAGGAPDDIWYVLYTELDDYRSDPASLAGVVAGRRRTREMLSELVPPFAFDAEMPPVSTWERRSDSEIVPVPVGSVLAGIAGCPGVATGRARVVLDPSQPGDLGPGDVLIAPFTDPSWTPLFVPVEAVVVDVGGQMSHAVIVSREFGLPCVVAVTGATTSIPDGALVEVDGTAGTVTVLEGSVSG
ncbi:MAG: phosphoenolpyruvate-utilizing protein [Actinobacteria bacterium]|nr:phosphoenolpyruvate-utilizing protein [Actinomycetota bacterium]